MAVKKGFSLGGASSFGANTDILRGGGTCFDSTEDFEDCGSAVNSKRARCLTERQYIRTRHKSTPCMTEDEKGIADPITYFGIFQFLRPVHRSEHALPIDLV